MIEFYEQMVASLPLIMKTMSHTSFDTLTLDAKE